MKTTKEFSEALSGQLKELYPNGIPVGDLVEIDGVFYDYDGARWRRWNMTFEKEYLEKEDDE